MTFAALVLNFDVVPAPETTDKSMHILEAFVRLSQSHCNLRGAYCRFQNIFPVSMQASFVFTPRGEC